MTIRPTSADPAEAVPPAPWDAWNWQSVEPAPPAEVDRPDAIGEPAPAAPAPLVGDQPTPIHWLGASTRSDADDPVVPAPASPPAPTPPWPGSPAEFTAAPAAREVGWGPSGTEGLGEPVAGTAPLPTPWSAPMAAPMTWPRPAGAPGLGEAQHGAGVMSPEAGITAYVPGRGRGPGWPALLGVAAVTGVVAALAGAGLGLAMARSDLDIAASSGTYATLAAHALPSVVTIRATSGSSGATGSGFVYDRAGHIVTNNHVVEGVGQDITVVLADGRKLTATIVGTDPAYDVAVLATDRSDLTPLPVGDSSAVRVGDEVLAMGAPLGLTSTVTAGIVSAVNRPVVAGDTTRSYINAIQTDAAINPGNSGGPLIDRAGKVIGVNSAIATPPGSDRTSAGNIGLGFAIPSDQVVKTADQLIESGSAEHPIIGVMLDTEYTGPGAKVRATALNGAEPVTENGPAAKAGIEPGDLIVTFDGQDVADSDDLIVAIRAKNVGDSVPVTVRRGTRTINVTMTLQAAKK